MKKYIFRILLFFSIVAAVDFAVDQTCEWLQNHAKGGRMKNVRQAALNQEAEIVIMGSSRARHHYVPSVFGFALGLSAYNAGVDGNGIVLATGLYEMMSERYSPRIIIYDVEPAFDIIVYSEDGNNTRYLGELRPYSTNPKVKEIICRVDPSERWKALSAMFRYNSRIIDLLKDQLVMGEYSLDGYVPLHGEMKHEPIIKTEDNRIVQDTLKLTVMEEFIKRLSQSDTRLVVVASPKYGAKSSEVFAPIKEMCSRYDVDFLDYYTATEFQQMDYFKESMHLNNKGARAFSEILAKRLKNDYKI